MKKLFALILSLALLCGIACAARIDPLVSVDMENDLSDCILRVSFTADDINEEEIIALVYDEVRYDTVDVHQLAIGDVIGTEIGDMTVESIDEDEGLIFINGGSEEGGGLTLWPDDGGTYLSMDFEYPCLILRGQAQLILADEVELSYWYEEEEGGIAEDLAVETVAAADLKDALAASGNPDCYASSCFVQVEEGLVTAVTVIFMP